MTSNCVSRIAIALTLFLATVTYANSQVEQASSLAAAAPAAKGLLSIFPDPPESEVFLNGAKITEYPFSKEMAVGTYDIRVAMTGWEEATRDIQVLEHRRTIVAARLLKPMPIELTAEDIGRQEKVEIDFFDVKKPEVEPVFERPEWPKRGKKASLVMMGVGLVTALATLEGQNFAETDKMVTQMSLAGLALGMTGFAIFYVIDDESGAWVEKENKDNIAFNLKRKPEIEKQNQEARAYNSETKRLLLQEFSKRTNEITLFNEGRGITVEVQ